MIKFKRNYPNVLLTSEDKNEVEAFRNDLSARGVYVHYALLSEFHTAAETVAADMVIIYSPKYSSRASDLYYKLAENNNEKKQTIIYIGAEGDVEKHDNTTIYPNNHSFACSEIVRRFKEDYRFDPAVGEDDELFCELGKPPQVYYNGTKIGLSKSESKIVHFLLTIEPRNLVSKEVIGDYLSLAAGAVPVHIHNINDKSMQTYHDKLVFSRSNRGYFVY